MAEAPRVVLAVVLLVAGVMTAVYACYLQYAALPGEYTVAQRGKRLALAVGGIALIVGGKLLP